MFKDKLRKLFIVVKLLTDICIIPISIMIGYFLKFKLYLIGLNMQINPNAQFENYQQVLIYIIFLWLFAFILNGMYKYYTGPLARMQELKAIFKGVLLGTFEVMAFTFLYPTFPESRYVMAYAAISAIILLAISRSIISSILIVIHKVGIGNKRAIVIGNDINAQRIAEKIICYPEFGFNLIGFVYNRQPKYIIHPLKNKISTLKLGSFEKLKDILSFHKINAVFLASQDIPLGKIYELAQYCQENDIHFRFLSSEYQRNLSFDSLDALPMMHINKLRFSLFNRFLKRTFDLGLAIPLTILFSPLFILIGILIKLTSPGPVIYKQTRVTLNGREFDFLKFRSMRPDSEKGKPILSVSDQSHRTTALGYWLRKTSLDELPQLFNVLKGDMSLVGPRPERPFFHQKYQQKIPHWDDRLIVRGGITGWAQLNGRAELTKFPLEKLDYDLYYIENWSILFDLKILWETIFHVLLQKDVY